MSMCLNLLALLLPSAAHAMRPPLNVGASQLWCGIRSSSDRLTELIFCPPDLLPLLGELPSRDHLNELRGGAATCLSNR